MTEHALTAQPPTGREPGEDGAWVYDRQAETYGESMGRFCRQLRDAGLPSGLATDIGKHWIEHLTAWGVTTDLPHMASDPSTGGPPPLWGLPAISAVRLNLDPADPQRVAGRLGEAMLATVAATLGAFYTGATSQDEGTRGGERASRELTISYFERLITEWRKLAQAALTLGINPDVVIAPWLDAERAKLGSTPVAP